MTEELKLPEPTYWVAAPPRGGLVLTEVQPSAWESHPIYTADQMREAIRQAVLMERERAARVCDEVERQQENDHGAANTGGAAACAAAIRKG